MYESKELKQEKETLPTTTLKNSSTNPMQLASILGNRGMIQLMGLEKQESKPNNTGIPTQMKQSFEERSGLSFDDVQVHYNSDKPVQLQALAYTQGNQVYVGPGQEKHLGHELGHVVQQKQGRVRATTNVNGMAVNDDMALEREADILVVQPQDIRTPTSTTLNNAIQLKSEFKVTPFNLKCISPIDSKKIIKTKVGIDSTICIDKGGQTTGSEPYPGRDGIYEFLDGYKKGHIVNQDLGGPGIPQNLFPFSAATNSWHYQNIEKDAKKAYAHFLENATPNEHFCYHCWLTGDAVSSKCLVEPDGVNEIQIHAEYYITDGSNKRSCVIPKKVKSFNPDPDWEE